MNTTDNQFFYNNDALKYDTRWSTAGGLHTDRIQKKIVMALCSQWRGKKVLEIGAGTGRFSLGLLDIVGQLTVVDLAATMLQVIKNKLQQREQTPNLLEYINASIYALPLKPNSFDCIVSINLFNHLENIELALRQCSRLIKKDGYFLFNYPNLYSYFWPIAYKINLSSKAIQKNVYSQWMRPSSIQNQLKTTGFEIEKKIGHVHLPRSLPDGLNPLLFRLDRISRSGPLHHLAPVHFCLCKKIE
jgi:ubiquinone/menaquinone biosynthesis C-methylase UbiE